MQNKTRVLVFVVFCATLAFVYSAKKTPPQTAVTNSAFEISTKPAVSEVGSEAGATVVKPATNGKPAPAAVITVPAAQQDTSKEDKTKFEDAELEKLRELNKTHVSRVTQQMKTDEISSLKKSIINDQLIIKKIEKDGSSIENYKMAQSNLEIRKKRLQQLLKK